MRLFNTCRHRRDSVSRFHCHAFLQMQTQQRVSREVPAFTLVLHMQIQDWVSLQVSAVMLVYTCRHMGESVSRFELLYCCHTCRHGEKSVFKIWLLYFLHMQTHGTVALQILAGILFRNMKDKRKSASRVYLLYCFSHADTQESQSPVRLQTCELYFFSHADAQESLQSHRELVSQRLILL